MVDPSAWKITAKDIADANRRLREACGASQSSAACAAAKEAYMSLYRACNAQNALPPVPKFEKVPVDLGEIAVGIAGCASFAASGGGGLITGFIGAASCGYTARDLGNLVIPEVRRVP